MAKAASGRRGSTGRKGLIAILSIVVLIVLIILLWDWDWDWFIPVVERKASARLGRKVTLHICMSGSGA